MVLLFSNLWTLKWHWPEHESSKRFAWAPPGSFNMGDHWSLQHEKYKIRSTHPFHLFSQSCWRYLNLMWSILIYTAYYALLFFSLVFDTSCEDRRVCEPQGPPPQRPVRSSNSQTVESKRFGSQYLQPFGSEDPEERSVVKDLEKMEKISTCIYIISIEFGIPKWLLFISWVLMPFETVFDNFVVFYISLWHLGRPWS